MRLSAIILVLTLMAAATGVQAGPGNTGKDKKDVFVVKTDKKYLGAKVQVFNSAGELLATQTVTKKKLAIDFGSVKLGTYTIRMSTKGQKTKEYIFVKTTM